MFGRLLVLSWISIHALLAESDINRRPNHIKRNISIHALLAESDRQVDPMCLAGLDFYPRSPCGERQLKYTPLAAHSGISIHALLAESDGFSYFYIIKIT